MDFCHSREFDYQKDVYIPIRESDLHTQHEIIFPHEDKLSIIKSKDTIKTCDVVFAEVSYPVTGLGIELGWTDSYEIPIICFHKTDSKVSSSLQLITNWCIEYSDSDDLIKKIEFVLSSSEIILGSAEKNFTKSKCNS